MSINQNKKSSIAINMSLKQNLASYLNGIITNRLFLILVFIGLTALASKIAVPIKPVPFTLQTMVVLLSGALLGKRDGFYSQIAFLALGSIGVPVFTTLADGTFGFASLFGPTGGYLLAFPIAAFLTGAIIEKSHTYFSIITVLTLSEVLILLSGVLFLNTFYIKDFSISFQLGGSLFILWTVAKIVFATIIVKKFKK